MALGFVFPGQGSQSVGMLNEIAAAYPQVAATFAEASEALGYDLWRMVQDGPAETLNATSRTQPAMLAAGVAMWRVWQADNGAKPAIMAGHSLGEYTALVCADVLDLKTAIILVEQRGRLMQEAVPAGEGAMAAILGLEDDIVRHICDEAQMGQVVQAVNYNSPSQVVIAGHAAAVNRALELAGAKGAKRAVMLPVSVPSHCSLMEAAARNFALELEKAAFRSPSIPVVNNVDATCERDPAKIRDALLRQLYSPVRWVEVVQRMVNEGTTTLIECGPGKVLQGLTKRIDRNVKALGIYDVVSLNEAIAS